MKRIAKTSGIAYLMIFIAGFYANFYAVESLIDLENANATIANLTQNSSQFMYGIIGFVVMLVFDLLLVWSLHILLKKVNKNISLTASTLRFINVLFFCAALLNLFEVYQIMHDQNLNIQAIETQQNIMSLLKNFNQIWIIGLMIFGVHLAFLGYLIFKSNNIPKSIGLLLFIAALGYVIDGIANFMMPNYADYKDIFAIIVIMPAVIGEFSFTIWLLIKGFKKQLA
ncbi:DUF4386 domain-containing protein [Pontimicrobium aquaticum]|uniref:DUF4386 domain-containing protein n=1 Tax=Pontimicrobium aquaticum TaxID=2565367 RepID=A0A4U0EVM0_9FLAO|nr:DUF4386 domain-containing protein [Pontimicrobium aquaticum]TJY35961.1 DUF4386 domain-containing protein [Pontimicrobium aquaticum]